MSMCRPILGIFLEYVRCTDLTKRKGKERRELSDVYIDEYGVETKMHLCA